MADTVTPAARSRIMSRVRSRDTAPEMAVRRALNAAGYRYRLHRKDLPGKPDIVLPRHRTAVQVHGCFWHGHRCRRGNRLPATNTEYWRTKIQRNRERDRAATRALTEAGWRVITIWECAIEAATQRLLSTLAGERGPQLGRAIDYHQVSPSRAVEELRMHPTEAARIAEIDAKVQKPEETYSVLWQSRPQPLPVITLSVRNVLLNPASHRIQSHIESHAEADILRREPHSERAQEIIENILAETPGFQALADSLRESGQLEFGIVTRAGVLVNGNTRAVALRKLDKEYIRVGVLPQGATEKEMTELEARLQLARDYKQEYTLTNELLFIQGQINAEVKKEDLALLLGKAQSRNRRHIEKGVAEIDKSLRILQHIREVQEMSGGAIPLRLFDEHESALMEADDAYMAIHEQDPVQARRVRDGRLAGVLVQVTYRNLRNWKSDQFVSEYVAPQFDDEDVLAAFVGTETAQNGSGPPVGLDILEGASEISEMPLDSSRLLAAVANIYGAEEDAPVGGGLTKAQLYDEIKGCITQAAQDSEDDRKDQLLQSAPSRLVQDARKKIVHAREAVTKLKRGAGLDHGELDNEVRQVRYELDLLSEANRVDA